MPLSRLALIQCLLCMITSDEQIAFVAGGISVGVIYCFDGGEEWVQVNLKSRSVAAPPTGKYPRAQESRQLCRLTSKFQHQASFVSKNLRSFLHSLCVGILAFRLYCLRNSFMQIFATFQFQN